MKISVISDHKTNNNKTLETKWQLSNTVSILMGNGIWYIPTDYQVSGYGK